MSESSFVLSYTIEKILRVSKTVEEANSALKKLPELDFNNISVNFLNKTRSCYYIIDGKMHIAILRKRWNEWTDPVDFLDI